MAFAAMDGLLAADKKAIRINHAGADDIVGTRVIDANGLLVGREQAVHRGKCH